MLTLARKLKRHGLNLLDPRRKSNAELQFWKDELSRYEQWYLGNLPALYWFPSPKEEVKVLGRNLRESSVLTWHKVAQETKYLEYLELSRDAFEGKHLLDVGSGPIPSATCFSGAKLTCLDPLHPRYVEAGFPYDCYNNVQFVGGPAEKMPLEDASFDVVIAVNSIDHVDNIKRTTKEIERVLKPGGRLRMHVHYHRATILEPIELNDDRVAKLFSWCPDFRKITEHWIDHGANLPSGEKFVLWGNSPA